MWLALFDKDQNEVSGKGYARANLSDIDFELKGGEFSNKQDITFPCAQDSWGSVVYMAIMNSETGGLRFGSLIPITAPLNVDNGDQYLFRPGGITSPYP